MNIWILIIFFNFIEFISLIIYLLKPTSTRLSNEDTFDVKGSGFGKEENRWRGLQQSRTKTIKKINRTSSETNMRSNIWRMNEDLFINESSFSYVYQFFSRLILNKSGTYVKEMMRRGVVEEIWRCCERLVLIVFFISFYFILYKYLTPTCNFEEEETSKTYIYNKISFSNLTHLSISIRDFQISSSH